MQGGVRVMDFEQEFVIPCFNMRNRELKLLNYKVILEWHYIKGYSHIKTDVGLSTHVACHPVQPTSPITFYLWLHWRAEPAQVVYWRVLCSGLCGKDA